MGAFLLGWNPVVLYETWGNGHNDMAMALWFLVAAWWISRHRYSLAVYSLVVGALFKFIPLLLIPVVIVIAWRDLQTIRERLTFVIKTFIGSCSIVLISYYPFWFGWETLNISARMAMFTTSIPSVINKAVSPTLGAQTAGRWISLVELALLLAFVIYQSFRRGSDPLKDYSQAAFGILAFYLMIVCLWFLHWYALWLIALAPLLSKRDQQLALIFGFWVLTQQLIFGPWLVPKILTAQPMQAVRLEALLAFGVLGVPWMFALWNHWKQKQRTKKEKYEFQNRRFDRRGETTRA